MHAMHAQPVMLARGISEQTLVALKNAPSLTRISWTNIPCDRENWDTAHGVMVDVAKIRRWRVSGGEFIWIKRRSHLVRNTSGQTIHLGEQVDHDITNWDGRALTDEELQETCLKGQLDYHWTEGEADGEMAADGVKFLTRLREASGH